MAAAEGSPTSAAEAHQQHQSSQMANAAVPAPPSLPRVLRERDYGALEKSQFPLFVQASWRWRGCRCLPSQEASCSGPFGLLPG